MSKNTEGKYITVSTKVSPYGYMVLRLIASHLGIDIYGLMSNALSCLIRYSDKWHQLDPVLMLAIRIFDQFENWSTITSITGIGKKECVQCIYFFVEPGKKGQIALLSKPSLSSEDSYTFNANEILNATLKAISPHTCKRLRELGEQLGCNTFLETIMMLCDEQAEDPDDEYIRELFADCTRSEFGRDTKLTKYSAHNKYTIYSHEQGSDIQQLDLFESLENSGDKTEETT